jgi:hypothetical protein
VERDNAADKMKRRRGVGTKKSIRKPQHPSLRVALERVRQRREAELHAEAAFSRNYALIEGQFFHKRHLERVMQEWRERRIIN